MCSTNCTDADLYGFNTNKICDFLKEIMSYSWLQNVGKPHPCDSEVIRVWTFEEGWNMMPEGKQNDIRMVGIIRRLFDQYKEKGILTRTQWDNCLSIPWKMVRDLPLKISDELHGNIASWASMAALELMVSLEDSAPYFFRRMTPWYRDGHWPVCIRDIDDKIVIY